MAIIKEHQIKREILANAATRMMAAARTAPKAKGRDTLEMIIVDGADLHNLRKEMDRLGKENHMDFLVRDAKHIPEIAVALIVGTKIKTLGLNEICQLCGFKNCSEKEKYSDTPCIFNTGDLHLALGSAAMIAASSGIDSRIMFSVGKAALSIGLFNNDIKIAMGILIAMESKNPFFDRPIQTNLYPDLHD